jgi:hypothetical protein
MIFVPPGIKLIYSYDNLKKKYIGSSRLVIGTSRTVGSAKIFVRITSGFGNTKYYQISYV